MQRKTIRATDGETISVSNQWAAETEKRGTTVSSSAWEYSGTGTISSEALTTPLASCLLAPTTPGILKNTATLSNGEVLIARRKVEVKDCPPMDYQ